MESLYRKYRPQSFEEIVGQKTVVRSLQNALTLGRLSQAYIFSGPRGTGKTTTARLLAKALNCLRYEKPTATPCNECASCRGITAGDSPDVLELDAASRTSVDDIRQLIENSRFKPAISRYRVFILDEAHMLSRSAFNALLKTLEEPPSFVVFILATTEPHKLPPTVLSRCQRFDFSRLTERDFSALVRRVAEKEGYRLNDDRFIALLYQYSGGAARDGLSLLEQVALYSGNILSETALTELLGVPETHLVIRLLEALVNGDAKTVLECAAEGYGSGSSFWTFLNVWASVVRDVLAIKAGLQPGQMYDEEDRRKLEAIALRASTPMLIDALEKQGDYRFTFKWESEGQLLWDMVFVSLLADFHAVRSGRGRAIPGRRSEPTPPGELLPVGPSTSQTEPPSTSRDDETLQREKVPPPEGERPDSGPITSEKSPEPSPASSKPTEGLLFSEPPPLKKTKKTKSNQEEGEATEPVASLKPTNGSRDLTGGERIAETSSESTTVAVKEAVQAPPVPPGSGAKETGLTQERVSVLEQEDSEPSSSSDPNLSFAVSTSFSQPDFPDFWPDFLEWLEEKDLFLVIYLAQAEHVEFVGARMYLTFAPDATISYRELLPPKSRKRIRELFEEFSGLACEAIELKQRQVDSERWREEVYRLVSSIFPGSEVTGE